MCIDKNDNKLRVVIEYDERDIEEILSWNEWLDA